MRLELKQIDGPSAGASRSWYFERGQRTLGRSGDCDWQVPQAARTVSKLHCTLLRDRDGFLLRDESANGTKVDGVVILEGDTRALRDGSRIEFGGLTFAVAITGDRDREMEDPDAHVRMSDEDLTITSILADVTPGGRSARGILAGQADVDWPPPARESKRRRGRDAGEDYPPTVNIGWDGPPQSAGDQTPVLPQDWNSDADFGSRLEHSSATRVSVGNTRGRSHERSAQPPFRTGASDNASDLARGPQSDPDDSHPAYDEHDALSDILGDDMPSSNIIAPLDDDEQPPLLAPAEPAPEEEPPKRKPVKKSRAKAKVSSGTGKAKAAVENEVAAPVEAQASKPAGRNTDARAAVAAAMRRFDALLGQCEEACDDAFAVFELEPDLFAEGADLFGTGGEEATLRRLEALVARQRSLARVLEGLVKETTPLMEPRIVEARIDAGPKRFGLFGARNYWQAYRVNFTEGENQLSVREYFRRAILRSQGHAEGGDSEDTTQNAVQDE